MLSAFKNFLITFGVSVVVFGLVAYFTVSYAIDATSAKPDTGNDGTTVVTESNSDSSNNQDGDNDNEVEGNSFNVLLIGTDLQEEKFDDYDPALWIWEDERYELKELSDTTKAMQTGLFKYRDVEVDSMVIMRVDKERREFTYTYIPGNMIVLSEGGNIQIGTLYASKGVDFLRHKVEAVTGLTIDYHVCVSVEELVDVINEIGAVDFEVPCDMEYEDKNQDFVIDITKGTKKLGGTGAEQVLRYNGYSPLTGARGSTNVKYIMELMKKATSEANFSKIADLYKNISELVDTNITVEFLLENADLIFSYSSYNCYELTYPGKYMLNDEGEEIFTPEVKNAIDMFYSYRLPYKIQE